MVAQEAPLKVAVIGLTHTHVHWILGREDRGDIEIVGIVEANEDLAQRYTKQHGLSTGNRGCTCTRFGLLPR